MSDLSDILEPILRKHLRPFGFDHADVSSGVDHDGEPALFVTAHYAPRAEAIDADAILDAIGEMQQALLRRGDDRFPYLRHDIAEPVATQ
jgi:hypothetical protein